MYRCCDCVTRRYGGYQRVHARPHSAARAVAGARARVLAVGGARARGRGPAGPGGGVAGGRGRTPLAAAPHADACAARHHAQRTRRGWTRRQPR